MTIDLRGLKEILRQMINADHERWHMLRDAVIAHCEQDADRIAALERERDEARAEVEQLRETLNAARLYIVGEALPTREQILAAIDAARSQP